MQTNEIVNTLSTRPFSAIIKNKPNYYYKPDLSHFDSNQQRATTEISEEMYSMKQNNQGPQTSKLTNFQKMIMTNKLSSNTLHMLGFTSTQDNT